jgi:hypothetical protein
VIAFAREQTEPQGKTPATKLEQFAARTGVVFVKGFTTVGSLKGLGGEVSVDVLEFRDARNRRSTVYGVLFTVTENGRFERYDTSFVDEDEIDSLIAGLDYISKIDRSITTFQNFEAGYATKDDLSFVVFSDSRGGVRLVVKSGRIAGRRVILELAAIDKIRALLVEAKKAIESAKAAAQ